jgi:hypothetical protein
MQRDEGVKRDRERSHGSQPTQRAGVAQIELGGGYAKALLNASRV